MVSIKFLILIQTGDIQGCLPCKHAFHTECLIPWLEVRTVVEITTLMILHFHNLAYLFPLKMPILNNFVNSFRESLSMADCPFQDLIFHDLPLSRTGCPCNVTTND